MTLRDWTDPRAGRHWKVWPTLVLGALVLFGGCGERGESVGPLPDEAFLAVVEYFQASPHIWVEPVFVVEDRLIDKGGRLSLLTDRPGSFRRAELSLQLRSRLIALGMEPCRVTDDIYCPERRGVSTSTLISVGDVLSRAGGGVTTWVVLISSSPDIPYAADVFSVKLTDGSEGWSVGAIKWVDSEP